VGVVKPIFSGGSGRFVRAIFRETAKKKCPSSRHCYGRVPALPIAAPIQIDGLSLRISLTRKLKALKVMQFLLDSAFQALARTLAAHPGPFAGPQCPPRAIRFEIDSGDDVVANNDRQGEIAKEPLFLWNVGLEVMIVAEEKVGSPYAG
jgi:hypothetical protein